MTISLKTHIFRKEGNVWDTAIFIPKEYADHFIDKNNKRIICTINEGFSFQAALMPQGNGDSFININAAIRKKLGLEIQDTIEILLEKDNSQYGLPLPEELKIAWDLDEEAYHIFHSMTMGKQRTLIHAIGKIKSTEKRIEKSLILLEYLKSVNGKIDFKELNEAFKNAK